MNNWVIQTSTVLNEKQFSEWQKLVEEKTGMFLPDHRKSFLQSSLNIRMREIGCDSYDQYFSQLASGMKGKVEWAVLVDRLTVHETHFFRHPESFDLVRNYLRRMIPLRAKQGKPINLWSVGCSTGEEPYSLAMLVEGLIFEAQVQLYYGITATDISLPSLSTARAGIYSDRRLAGITELQKDIFFEKKNKNQYEFKQKYKDKICFARVNLLELEQAPIDRVDIIFCQNVLIYFQKERKHEIVTNLANSLEPGALMVLGLGDVAGWSPDSLKRVKAPNVLAFTRNID